ncbi:MAG: hypothetical protein D6729_10195, partial [Deltaproteobacteria bacterium]
MDQDDDFPPRGGTESGDDTRGRSRLEGFVPDAVKKLALAGVGALFMTEEGIRNLVGEMKLPRDAVANLIAQTERARGELFRMIALEFRRFLEHANLSGEIAKALEGITVDVTASIRFRRNESGDLVPELESKSRRTERDAAAAAAAAGEAGEAGGE